ncbi:hypothetical protein IQ07DRAFT_370453 [Pyrenochaeta sp. DS3sAY3a]|nr:hypothetical protein IQ07DRAFT_370453 [Pyrenochaeta sp. DS3sAY3a]
MGAIHASLGGRPAPRVPRHASFSRLAPASAARPCLQPAGVRPTGSTADSQLHAPRGYFEPNFARCHGRLKEHVPKTHAHMPAARRGPPWPARWRLHEGRLQIPSSSYDLGRLGNGQHMRIIRAASICRVSVSSVSRSAGFGCDRLSTYPSRPSILALERRRRCRLCTLHALRETGPRCDKRKSPGRLELTDPSCFDCTKTRRSWSSSTPKEYIFLQREARKSCGPFLSLDATLSLTGQTLHAKNALQSGWWPD